MTIALAPSGSLYVTVNDGLTEAFSQGSGFGLLALAAAPPAADPATSFFRDLARDFIAAACRQPGAEEIALPPDLATRALSTPPLQGTEYLTEDVLVELWRALQSAFKAKLSAHHGSPESFVAQFGGAWHLVGRVCFHLAENKRTPETPFAFMATYTSKLSADDRVKHLPLGRALEEYAGAKNKGSSPSRVGKKACLCEIYG